MTVIRTGETTAPTVSEDAERLQSELHPNVFWTATCVIDCGTNDPDAVYPDDPTAFKVVAVGVEIKSTTVGLGVHAVVVKGKNKWAHGTKGFLSGVIAAFEQFDGPYAIVQVTPL